MINRINLLQNKIKDTSTAFLITSEVNRVYLTGFRSSAGIMIITKEKSYFLTDFRYFEAAEYKILGCEVVKYSKLAQSIEEIIKKHNIKIVNIETTKTNIADGEQYKKICQNANAHLIKSDMLDKILSKVRRVKQTDEIKCIKSAQEITDKAFIHILNFIKIGLTEKQVAFELEMFMRQNGADGVAFDIIVASGENSSLPHGVPCDKKIQKGDIITMDFGALLDGYHSDMTRTVAVGSIRDEQKEIYNIVLNAQSKAIEKIKKDVLCLDIDKTARSIIENAGYGKYFGHSTGHGVGLEIHESPSFAPACDILLEPNMVITVEPGIYLPQKFGIRIEDMVVVTENNCENLTKSYKDLIII